ncbi:hypothetical protein ACFQU7_08265 [Pseudoroseomonas wenyumeiae]
MGARLGQTFVVENRGGAGGVLGNEAVSTSPRTATPCCWAAAAAS